MILYCRSLFLNHNALLRETWYCKYLTASGLCGYGQHSVLMYVLPVPTWLAESIMLLPWLILLCIECNSTHLHCCTMTSTLMRVRKLNSTVMQAWTCCSSHCIYQWFVCHYAWLGFLYNIRTIYYIGALFSVTENQFTVKEQCIYADLESCWLSLFPAVCWCHCLI